MRICLAIPSLQTGGMERVMSEIACDFSKRNDVELHLLMFGRDRTIFYDIPQSVIVHKPSFSYVSSQRTLFTVRTLIYIRRELKRIKPDVVLSFGNYWNSLVLLSAIGTRIKIFVSDRSRPDKDMGRIQNKLRKVLYPRAAGVIAQTSKAYQIYQQWGLNSNMTIIGNPIRRIQRVDNNQRQKIVLSVGRLINTKHYDRLINIFSEIDNREWKLIIVGGDALHLSNSEKYRKQIENLKLEDRVILTGIQKDVDKYYNMASIFVFPSSSEGFPNVVGEAMSAGLPVISYDCIAGPSDMIEDGKNGFLIPVFNDILLKERLIYLMNNTIEREKMGQYASESIKQFDSKKICASFYNFITNSKF